MCFVFIAVSASCDEVEAHCVVSFAETVASRKICAVLVIFAALIPPVLGFSIQRYRKCRQ